MKSSEIATWLNPANIEQWEWHSSAGTKDWLGEKLIEHHLPCRRICIKEAEEIDVWAESESDAVNSDTEFSDAYSGTSDIFDVETARSTAVRKHQISLAQYQYTFPKVFVDLYAGANQTVSLIEFATRFFTPASLDAVYRLHGRDNFAQYMIELRAANI